MNDTEQDAIEDTLDDSVEYDEDQGAALVQKLREKVKTLEKQKQEYLDGWQRMKADVVNRDKAAEEARGRVADLVKERMLEDLLPVLDAFDAAFTGAAWEKVDGNWRIGIEYIHSQFKKVLEENGVKPFEALGATFDPMKHDPAGEEETEDKPVGTIAKVLRQGYEIGGRVIRPSRVIVFKSKE